MSKTQGLGEAQFNAIIAALTEQRNKALGSEIDKAVKVATLEHKLSEMEKALEAERERRATLAARLDETLATIDRKHGSTIAEEAA